MSINLTQMGLRSTFASIFRMILQIFTQILFARILGPEPYGIFTVGIITISFLNFFADYGITYSIIQSKREDDLFYKFIFTHQLIISSLIFLIFNSFIFFSGDYFFREIEKPCIYILSILTFINPFAAISTNILRRRFDLYIIQKAQIIAYVFGYFLIGLPLAILNFGHWSLVISWLVFSVVSTFLCYREVKHPLGFVLWDSSASNNILYGITVFFTNAGNWLVLNLDRIFINQYYGSTILGLYSNPLNLIYNGSSAILGPVQQLFFSLITKNSTEQTENYLNNRSYLSILHIFIILFGFFFSILSIHSDLFVNILFGEKWLKAGPIFKYLCLCMPFFLIYSISSPMIWMKGKGRFEALLNLPVLVISFIVYFFTSKFDIVIFAQFLIIIYAFKAIIILISVCKICNISIRDLSLSFGNGFLVVFTCYILSLTTKYLISKLIGFSLISEVLALICSISISLILLRFHIIFSSKENTKNLKKIILSLPFNFHKIIIPNKYKL